MTPEPSQPSHTFPPTMWSMLRLAIAEGSVGADQALGKLCDTYQHPILAYILRDGYELDQAKDLKQAFFEHLLEKNALADAESTRVKLRAFLITKLQGFLVDQHRRGTAQKRGWGKVVSIGDLSEEQQRIAEPVNHVTPYIAYQLKWMETLVTTSMEQLREDYFARGLGDLYTAIAPFITSSSDQSIAALAAQLQRPEGTLKSDISRLRAKCQHLIRDQIAATLDEPSPEGIDTELTELMGYRR